MPGKNSVQGIQECLNFIEGQWTQPAEPLGAVISPLTGKQIAKTFRSSSVCVNRAVLAAKSAQESWAQWSLRERSAIFYKFNNWITENLQDLIQTISMECGKLPEEARDGLYKGMEIIEFAASFQNHDTMTKMQVSRGIFCEYRREPLGIVAGITPCNFPAMVPLWMIPIAIMTGNSFIWKPSEKTPMTSILLCEGLKSCGLPDGILSVVQGDKTTVDALCDHKDIQAIGFVGSSPVAKYVYSRATQNGKRALTLGGAKNHIILMPDAQPEIAVDGIIASFSGCAGQRCMAASVLLAVGDTNQIIHEIAKKAANFKAMQNIGAIITKQSLEKLVNAIEKAVTEGARLLVDGRNPTVAKEYSNGNWLCPTILDEISPNSFCAQEELFGPILSIVRCHDIEHAIKIENHNRYGNAASVFTSRGDIAEYVTNNAKSGMIGINIGIPVPREPFSFGGIHDSKFGHGDMTGHSGVDFWSLKKKVTTKWFQAQTKNWMS